MKKAASGRGLPAKFQVLLVCTGNTCRTPMAEGLLKDALEKQGAQLVSVKSAGTFAVEGMPASFIGISVMRKNGVNIMNHRSQPLSKKLVDKSDLILVMAENHYQYLTEKYPQFKDKVHLLKNYMREELLEEPNVTDPIGGDIEMYEEVFADLQTEIQRVTSFIVNASFDKL